MMSEAVPLPLLHFSVLTIQEEQWQMNHKTAFSWYFCPLYGLKSTITINYKTLIM
jgi:hypothetical protein